MAIKSNKKVDFEYEYEAQDGDSRYNYAIALRFYHGEEYGPTIAVLDSETGEPAINFPAAMFQEVTDFLISQGILGGKKTLPMTQMPPKAMNIGSKSNVLPKPRLVSTKPNNPVKIGNKIREAIPVDLEDDSPEEQPYVPEDLIRKEQQRLNQITEDVEGSVPAQSLSENAEQNMQLSSEEIKEIMEQRARAISKEKKNPIRKKD